MKGNKLILIFVLWWAVFLTISCKGPKTSGPQAAGPVQVVAFTVQSGEVVYYDSYPGTVVAINEVQLRSEVTGFITGFYFTEGSRVNKGSKLYEIDRTKYQAAWEAAKDNVEIAKSNLQKAERDADRYSKLDEQNAIAKQTLEDSRTTLENMRLQLKTSIATLSNAETDYNYSLITAPFAGTIGFSQVKQGAFVTAGQTLLNTISSDDPIGVEFVADEKSLTYFLGLRNTKLPVNDSAFKVVLPDNSYYKYNGKLTIIDRAVDPQTGTIKIRVDFSNTERSLRPGMNCTLKILNENSGMQVTIPYRAIAEQMGEYFVYLIDSSNTVRQKRIMPGQVMGATVVIKSGLKPGDKIVLEGIQKIRDGIAVKAVDFVEGVNKNNPVKGKDK